MKSTKKILGASAALGLAVALSAGSTFAWFITSGRTTAQVNGITVNVISQVDGSETLNVYVPTLTPLQTITGGSGEEIDPSIKPTYSLFESTCTPTLSNIPQLQPLTLLQVTGDEWVLRTQDNTNATSNSEDSGFLYFTVAFASSAPLEIYLDTTKAATLGATTLKENKSSVLEGTAPTEDKTESWTYGKLDTFDKRLYDFTAGDSSTWYGDYNGIVYNNDGTINDSAQTITGSVRLEARAANATRLLFEELAPAIASGENAYTPSKLVWSPNEAKFSGAEIADANNTITDSTQENNPKGFWKNNLARDFNTLRTQLNDGATLKLPESSDGASYFTQKDYSANGFKALIPYAATLSGNESSPQENNNLTGTNAATKIATLQKVRDASNKPILNKGGIVFADGKKSVWAPSEYITDVNNYYAFVNIKVWLEGTDGDCFESVLGDQIKINLAFKGVKPQTQA